MNTIRKAALLQKRRWRIRKKVTGTAERPRMSVPFTAAHIYVQFIDDGIAQHKPPRDPKPLVADDQRFANGDSGRYGNSLQYLHRSAKRTLQPRDTALNPQDLTRVVNAINRRLQRPVLRNPA